MRRATSPRAFSICSRRCNHGQSILDRTLTYCRHVSGLNPGGVLVVTPEATVETFQQNKTIATPTTRKGPRDELDVVFIENVYDPDPADEQYETTVLYLIGDHGHLRIETDRWTMGHLPLDTWRRVRCETGFDVHEGRYDAGEDEYTVFACVKTS